MSKKKGKGQIDNANWDEGLINEKLSDDKWQPFVAFIVPSMVSSENILKSLTNAVQEGSRRRFIVINKESMLASARDDSKLVSAGGGAGGRKSKTSAAPVPSNKPLHPEVCEHVVTALSSGSTLPASLVARMLKYKILRKRTADLAAKEALLKEAEEALKQSKAGINAKGKGATGGGRASKRGGKDTPSKPQSGKGGTDGGEGDFPMPKKPPSTMKKRGEEDKSSKYIDDEPKDGPSAFILLTGFHEAEVFQHLEKLGVTANALVKVDQTSKDEESVEISELSDEEQLIMAKKTNELAQFWYHIPHSVSSSQDGSMLRDMAMIELLSNIPPSSTLDDNIEERKLFGQTLYTSLSVKLYGLLNSFEQYQNYLKYLDIKIIPLGVSVPVSPSLYTTSEGENMMKSLDVQSEPIQNSSLKTSVDMRLYKKLLEDVPESLITPSVVLYCMIEQVDSLLSLPTEDTQTDTNLHAEIDKTFQNILSLLPPSQDERNILPTNAGVKSSKVSTDQCCNWQDEFQLTSIKTHSPLCMATANKTTTELSLSFKTISFPSLTPSLLTQYEKQFHSLKHFCSNIDGLQLDTILTGLLVTLSLECILPPSSSCLPDNGIDMKTTKLLFDYPLDIPLKIHKPSNDIALIPVDKESVNPPIALDIPTPLLNLTDYTVLEPLAHEVIHQIIRKCHHTHPYMHMYYHKLTESLIVAMYSGYSSTEPISEYSWNEYVHTRVGFSNYLKYVQGRVGENVDKSVEEDEEQRDAIEENRKTILEIKKKDLEEKKAASAKKESESKQSSAKGGKKVESAKKTSGKKSALASRAHTPASTDDLELIASLPQFVERTLYTGYDVGDTVILSMGVVNKAFTNDGVCITNEKRQFGDGPVTRRVTLTNEHVSLSAVHIQNVDPQPPPTPSDVSQESPAEQDEQSTASPTNTDVANPIPQPRESILFSAIEGSLYNGVTLSVSHYGPVGDGSLPFEPKSAKELEKIDMQCRPESSKDSRPPSQQAGGKVSKKQQEEQQRLLEQQRVLEEKLAKERIEVISRLNEEKTIIGSRSKYQQLNLTTEQGLHINCSIVADQLEGECNGSTIIKQERLLKNQPPPLSEESSRTYLPDGNVIRYMNNKTVTVLCKDGSVFKSLSSGSLYDSLFDSSNDMEPPQTESQSMSMTRVSFVEEFFMDKGATLPKEFPSPMDVLWEVTRPNGSKCVLRYVKQEDEVTEKVPENGDEIVSSNDDVPVVERVEEKPHVRKTIIVNLEPLASYTATDPETKEVLITREDKTMVLKKPNGLIISEYCDGTRITFRPLDDSNIIIMEHPIFARVTYKSRNNCTLDLPSNTQIVCNPLGEYMISEHDKTSLKITSDGTMIYKNEKNQNSLYTLSHTNEEQILKGKDKTGRTYSVSFDDGISVSEQPDSSELCDQFLPKIFVLNHNGNGFQLCDKRDVDSFIINGTKTGAVVTRDKLPQCPQIDTITVISTDVNHCDSTLLPYAGGNIVPKNLKCCNSHNNGQSQVSKPKKRFGVGVGKGLSVGTYTPPLPTKVFKRPKKLKYRQFINFAECGLKKSLLACLRQYIQWRNTIEDNEDKLLPDTMEDCLKQGKVLLQDVLTLSSMISPEELIGLYQAEWEKENTSPLEPTEQKKKVIVVADDSITKETEKQKQDEDVTAIETTANEPPPPMGPTIEELSSNLPMNQIKRKSLVSFSIPGQTKHHLLSSYTEETSLHCDSPSPVANTSIGLGISDMEVSFSSETGTETLHPLLQMAALSTPCRSEELSSPMPRPDNPTPHQAANNQSDTLITSTPSEDRRNENIDKGLTPSAPTPILTQSLEYCASGNLRQYPVKLPRSISGGKPGETFNEKFFSVEEPVRRKIHTSSTTQGALTRGFEVFPSAIQFGNLKEGCTYSYTCTLKNIGIDTCRFKIKTPPPSTGIRVLYKPGPVVAGMSREFIVEIFALAIGASTSIEVGGVSYELEIITEANLLHVSVKACIFPPLLYKQCFSGTDSLIGASKNTQLVTERPSSREDLNRPVRKTT